MVLQFLYLDIMPTEWKSVKIHQQLVDDIDDVIINNPNMGYRTVNGFVNGACMWMLAEIAKDNIYRTSLPRNPKIPMRFIIDFDTGSIIETEQLFPDVPHEIIVIGTVKKRHKVLKLPWGDPLRCLEFIDDKKDHGHTFDEVIEIIDIYKKDEIGHEEKLEAVKKFQNKT